MENETIEEVIEQIEQKDIWTTVTPFSKYLALFMFITLPFLGGWIGYTYALEQVVEIEKEIVKEVERIVVKEVEVEQDNLVMRNVSSKNYSLYEGLCPNEVTGRGQKCYWLFEMSSGKFFQELNKLAREQGAIEDSKISLTSFQYSTEDRNTLYFLTGIADSGACCRLVELDVEQMKFSARDDLYVSITASEISSSGRYIASAADELSTFKVVDLEIGEVVHQESVGNGGLNSTICSMDGYANDIAFSEDEFKITYGIYSDTKVDECDFELLEQREYQIGS